MAQTPVVVGLTVCHDVVRDGQPGEYSVVRAFTGVRCTSFPARMETPLCVLAVLTDGDGEIPFDLLLTRYAEAIEPLRQMRGVLRFRDRRQPVELVVRHPQFVFPRPGVYQFSLFLSGEWAAQTAVRVYLGGDST